MRFTQSNVTSFKPPAGKADHWEPDDALPGFGLRFRNGSAGVYAIRYSIADKDRRLSLGKLSKITLDAARTAARKQFAMLAERLDPNTERAKRVAKVTDTIEPLIDAFLDWLAKSKKRNGEKRSTTYLSENTRTLKVYCKGLHRYSADDINRKMIAEQLAKIRIERGPISGDRSRAHLSKLFNWAIAEGRAASNPVDGTNKIGSNQRARLLADNELKAVWQSLGDDDYGAICRLLILTGARRDEIGSLSRSEINLAQKQIELPGSRTKSGLDTIIPLSPLALSILKAREPREGSDFVFGRGTGGFSGWSASKARLDEKLPGVKHFVLHDFRRAISTVMHDRLDVAPHVVESVLGHISGHKGGVGGNYNKAQYLDQKRAALEKYADHVNALMRAKLAVVK
jgi:integrase